MDIGFAPNYTNLYLIDITPTGPSRTWARLGQGISTAENDDDETKSDDEYYDGDGSPTTDVTSNKVGYTFEGNRRYGNAAQDYIANLRTKVGEDRKTNFRHIEPNGSMLEGPCTITDIVATGGDAGDKGTFECGVYFNGMPNYVPSDSTTAPDSVTVTAVSVAVGATSEVNPTVTPTSAPSTCAYAVDDTTIATVDDSGVVTGVKVGTCNLSVKCMAKPSVKETVKVTVTAKV